MRAKLCILLAGLVLALPAQTRLTVEQLVKFIQSSVKLNHADKDVAGYLRKQSLTERLDDRTIEDLQSEGVGPRTLEALRTLRDASKDLPAPPTPAVQAPVTPLPPTPPPSSEEQRKIIDQARDYALNYSKSLPNFICTQVTRRYLDPHGMEFWSEQDILTARLSYFEQKENYKLVLVNNHAITGDTPYMAVGGAISTGEFGSMMKEVFDPETETDFRWDRWGKLRGRVAHVYTYRVAQARSKWRVTYEKSDDIVPGYHGLVYVDQENASVLRITLEADLPPSFPVQQVSDTLDYDLAPIGSREYMLPLKAVMRSRHGKMLAKNDVEFRLYRRFSAEAEIKYDTPDPLPEDKTQEQPPK